MRYYEFVLNTSAEEITKNTTIRLRDYDYDSPIGSINKYLFQKLKNGVYFLAYREEESDAVYAVLSYDESKNSLSEAYEHILEMLSTTFRVHRVKEEPYEITGNRFYDCIIEARRRAYFTNHRFVDSTCLRLYDYYDEGKNPKQLLFEFEERIIPETSMETDGMYDEAFLKELNNIKSHENDAEQKGNMVHYIISGRSMEAACDMTAVLMQRLFAAKRISTKRMMLIKDMDPDIYMKKDYIEEIIENNFGGAIVFDLTEKFGCDPVEYKLASKFMEQLVKKYRKNCLFVFLYNIDKPGFSYFLLPELKKYVLPVVMKEGTGDRTEAVNYMEKLIRTSEYSMYAEQAGEFMECFPGDKFSQTDVLMAYEQFDAWCMNKNILKAYDYTFSDDFMLERDDDTESSSEKLEKLVGLDIVKKQINNILTNHLVEKERKNRNGKDYQASTMHMIFSGNPGTAKTTVAKLFARIAKEKGLLKSGAFVECGGMDLSFVCTIRDAFTAAKGGVLFIDEAYELKFPSLVTTLIQEMENHRDEVIVVLAGYEESMRVFMERNEGLKSRIPYWVDFPDYSESELIEIFQLMIKERGFRATNEAMNEARDIFEKIKYVDNFGNGRYVRNLVEHAIQNQSVRLHVKAEDITTIAEEELFLLTKEDVTILEDGLKAQRPKGTALGELEDMIGLSSVKAVIKKAIASYKLKKFCIDQGIRKDRPSMHMVFKGNPGTAKTTVARLFAEIMNDERILPTGKFVEAGRADLVGPFSGSTAILVKQKFREAKGGVLFIDEAYALCDSHEGGFGDEAINTIVQEMENRREDTIVIFAGYPAEMQKFLDRNPGLSSRIAFHVDFEDYTTEELCDITRLMLTKKKMTITDAAMEKLRIGYETASKSSDYGNGRFVRKMLEEAEMNLAQRVFAQKDTEITTELISVIEECDIPEISTNKNSNKKPMGFSVA